MNLSEFKAWFEGFTENLSGAPTPVQWTRIQAKIAEITDAPATSYPVYVDRWVRPYWREYWQPYYGSGGIGMSYSGGAIGAASSLGMQCMNNAGGGQSLAQWNAGDAFRDLGRAEANSLAS